MARIAVDMDEVIADFNVKFVASFNQQFGQHITASDLTGIAIPQRWPSLVGEIAQMISEPDFFLDLPVMPDSQEILERISHKHDVFITTAAMEFPSCFNAKFTWMQANFPFISPMNIVFCGDKSIIHADYLIDDNSRHFPTFCGEGILYSAPHNMNIQGYRRVNNWQEIGEIFL